MKKALIFVLALVLLVGVFAACGDKKPAETTGPATTQGTTEKPTTEKPTTEKPTTETPTTETPTTEEVFSTVPYDPMEPGNTPEGEIPGFEFPIDPNPNEEE